METSTLTSHQDRVLIAASDVRRVYEAHGHTHVSLGRTLGVSRETATRFLSRGVVAGSNPSAVDKLLLLLTCLERAEWQTMQNAAAFALGEALAFEPIYADTSALRQGGVKATLYGTNQALLLRMEPGAVDAHNQDSADPKLATIEVLTGTVGVEYGRDTARLKADTHDCGAFNISAPYRVTAEERSTVLLLARPGELPQPAALDNRC